MKLKLQDLVALVLLAAIGVPYVGYLVKGEMPFVEDPRGMSAVGLVLGVVAYLVLQRDDTGTSTDKAEAGMALASVSLGVVALALAETAAAEVLLAVFMASILVVVAVKIADHAGAVTKFHRAKPTG